jgi:hypothetical protein
MMTLRSQAISLHLRSQLYFSIFWQRPCLQLYTPCTQRSCTHTFKGSLTRDFRLQVFFMNQCPPGPQVFQWGRFEFFRKFAEIFANETVQRCVNDTGEKFIAGVIVTSD